MLITRQRIYPFAGFIMSFSRLLSNIYEKTYDYWYFDTACAIDRAKINGIIR